jgi:hypothetical protein
MSTRKSARSAITGSLLIGSPKKETQEMDSIAGVEIVVTSREEKIQLPQSGEKGIFVESA